MAATKTPMVKAKVLMRGEIGGKVVQANTDYATGGPVHPDVAKQKGAPDPAKRDPDEATGERFIGDVVEVPADRFHSLVRSGWVSFPVPVALADPERAGKALEAIRAGRTVKLPFAKPAAEPTPPSDPSGNENDE